MKVILSAEGMQKTSSTFSNAMMDCIALLTHKILPWSHFQDSHMQGFLKELASTLIKYTKFREVVIQMARL